jgi:hypothetical protein
LGVERPRYCLLINLIDIQPSITHIHGHLVPADLRAITYLATYDDIRSLAIGPGVIGLGRFNQLAAMVYGWMPRIVRIDPAYVAPALATVAAAQHATRATAHAVPIDALANCLRSLVGASKVLHFVNDTVFPIWDSKIETFRQGGVLPYGQMTHLENYLAYVTEVHNIRADPAFAAFFAGFTAAMNARLTAIGIPLYAISEVRAIEAAAFELA